MKIPAFTQKNELEPKFNHLKEILSEMRKVLVAFSGGNDSTFLLFTACQVLGNKNVFAAARTFELLPAGEADAGQILVENLGVKHLIFKSNLLKNDVFLANTHQRCYICKKELCSKLSKIASEEGIFKIVDGTNFDDLKEFRPGIKALKESGIRSPLAEVKLRKDEVRTLSRKFSLPTWNKPSLSCLATRLPYGEPITLEKIHRIDLAETFLKELRFTDIRVRLLKEDTVCIEANREEIPRLLEIKNEDSFVERFKELGFFTIWVDPKGYQSGKFDLTKRKRVYG